MLRYSLLIVVVLFSGYEAFDKRKDDLVVMKSDDNFTGEIKSLHYDELIFKSDYMSREGLRACAVSVTMTATPAKIASKLPRLVPISSDGSALLLRFDGAQVQRT